VLAVGALDSAGSLASYSYWDEKARKPDVFALGQLEGTALAAAVSDPSQVGTSFAALHVAAAGILIWATDRTLSAHNVRRLIESTARPLPRGARRKTGPRELNLARALARVRSNIVTRALANGPLQIEQLIAACALSTPLVVGLVEELESRGKLHRVVREGADHYELML
jgi:subtilisin family serine protease